MSITEWIPGSHFRSRLYTAQISDTRNAELFLVVRVTFLRHGPQEGHATVTDDDQHEFATRDASQSEFDAAKQRFVADTQATWDRQWTLVPRADWGTDVVGPDSPCASSRGRQLYRPNVLCRLQLIQVPLEGADLTVRLVWCEPHAEGHRFRAYTRRRDHVIWLDGDARERPPVASTAGCDPASRRRSSAAHEFGHFLGLDHPRHGHELPNSPAEYGDAWSVCTVMGAGSRRDAWQAWPWMDRLPRHAHAHVLWDTRIGRIAPRMLASCGQREANILMP